MEDQEQNDSEQFEELIQGLIDRDYGCCNNFITLDTIKGLSNNIQRLNAAGKLKESGIGNQDNFLIDQAVRGDKINWIAGESTDPFEMIYLKKIDRFIKHLNTTCFTSIKSVESHYASYEKFRFYKRHHDQFKQEKGRDFSIILYLNVSWLEADGGILSLYPVGKSQEDIAPLGGRMIFFRSSDMEHEVHASNTRERNSIAGWLKKV